MEIAEAQLEMRSRFAGGFYGQIVSGLLWVGLAALASWSSPRAAITTLVLGGFFIFPITELLVRTVGRRPPLRTANSLWQLGMQVAFVLPASMPLLLPVGLYRLNWFYPAMMILLGCTTCRSCFSTACGCSQRSRPARGWRRPDCDVWRSQLRRRRMGHGLHAAVFAIAGKILVRRESSRAPMNARDRTGCEHGSVVDRRPRDVVRARLRFTNNHRSRARHTQRTAGQTNPRAGARLT